MDATGFIALGSNMGRREENLNKAIILLEAGGVDVVLRSSNYNTAPVGGPSGQGDYLNAVVGVNTTKTPEELLAFCLSVEEMMGRVRKIHWGPRIIDLDMLLFGGQIIDTPRLSLPHPEMQKRRFVLEPLTEIAPDVRHPVLKKTASELLAACRC